MEPQKKYLLYSMLKLKEEMALRKLKSSLYDAYPQDIAAHGFDHLERVVKNATLLLSSVPEADAFVTLSIAYLHDLYDHKINPVDDVELAILQFFKEYQLDMLSKEKEIALGASQIGYSIRNSVGEKSIESILVSEADYLDAMGPFGLIRTIEYGSLDGRPLTETVDHISDKLIKLNGLLQTPKALELGKSRHEFLMEFLRLYNEDK